MVYTIINKNRYNYYKDYIKYAVSTKSNIEIKKNKDRYLYYNKYLYYLNQKKPERLDLSSRSLFINSNVPLEKKSISTNTESPNTLSLIDSIKKPYSNRFNVLDLLLPSINQNILDTQVTNSTILTI